MHREGHQIRQQLGEILQWVKDAEKADVEKMREQIEFFESRITSAAVLTLLEFKLNDTTHGSALEKFRDGIFLPCLRSQSDGKDGKGKAKFAEEVLGHLLLRSDKAVQVLETLAEKPDELPDLTFSCSNFFSTSGVSALPQELWPFMFRAMRYREDSQAFFDMALKLGCKLPFESSKMIRSRYIEECRKRHRGSESEVLDHMKMLQGRDSRVKLFDHLMESYNAGEFDNLIKSFDQGEGPDCKDRSTKKEESEEEEEEEESKSEKKKKKEREAAEFKSLLALFYFTWWSSPAKIVPPQWMPRPAMGGSWKMFEEITSLVINNGLCEADEHAGLSLLARFVIEPHTLPASILNTLKVSIIGDPAPVISHTYALAQMESPIYPVYGFRTHTRHLPEECRKLLVQKCRDARDSKVDTKSKPQEEAQLYFPLTDRGVSPDTVNHNLNILVNIDKYKRQDLTNCTDQQRKAQIFLPTLTWFEAAGFKREELQNMCAKEEDRLRLSKNFEAMETTWKQDEFPRAYVYQLLPVYVEVRFCKGGKDIQMFQNGRDSKALTKEWLSMLTEHYKVLGLDASKEFDKYVTRKPKAMSPPKIIQDLFLGIAQYLTKIDSDMVDAVVPIVVSAHPASL